MSATQTERAKLKKITTFRGFTLVETMVSMAISVVLVALGLIAAFAIQRSFDATIRYSRAQNEQVRVLDYMALDLRRALGVSLTGGILQMTIPDYYDSSGNHRTPTISNGYAVYGVAANAPLVRYYQVGNDIIREQAGVPVTIAENIEVFQFTPHDYGQVIEVAVTFRPTFRVNGSQEAAREGTRAVIRTLLRNRMTL